MEELGSSPVTCQSIRMLALVFGGISYGKHQRDRYANRSYCGIPPDVTRTRAARELRPAHSYSDHVLEPADGDPAAASFHSCRSSREHHSRLAAHLNAFTCSLSSRPHSGNLSGAERFGAGSSEAMTTWSNGPRSGGFPSTDHTHTHSCTHRTSHTHRVTWARRGFQNNFLTLRRLTAPISHINRYPRLGRCFTNTVTLTIPLHFRTQVH